MHREDFEDRGTY